MPIANTVAAAMAVGGELARLRPRRPRADTVAEPMRRPMGESRWTIGPANHRPTAISPLIHTSTRMPPAAMPAVLDRM